jgi:plasmid stabilization system protein ParE
MTGRINYTPEAEQQLNELDDWIAQAASAEIAQRFVSALLDHVDGILLFPFAGRATTLVAYALDTSDELVVNILGVFHGGQDWEAVLNDDQRDREADR